MSEDQVEARNSLSFGFDRLLLNEVKTSDTDATNDGSNGAPIAAATTIVIGKMKKKLSLDFKVCFDFNRAKSLSQKFAGVPTETVSFTVFRL
ncbi:hypothetical protein LEP1GSC060_1997 [Leptospira weilii serovar Ranarum str. ICFT]|uniref:Uncharacterized protein n=1 Tax=Leptospira weilii serovar Ranarum str. ICFT TaxID=1218598 RepID=N1WA48_9LEPT|nr:hypothetical protein LEP1GSC060_1997 [Leptospira weilii serovar Ranarum str. ICFT]